MTHPNIIYVFADQWRAQACGYAGNTQVRTPNIDRFHGEAVSLTNAAAGAPVCTPYRASLLTGRLPIEHGVFLNDVALGESEIGLGDAFAAAGYDTGYIGKWHVGAPGSRSAPIPPERRLGFDYWKVLECTHDYNHSRYYAGDETDPRVWDEYDAAAQTEDAIDWLTGRDSPNPFLLLLSWGPPHNPYQTAPDRFRSMYAADDIELRPNVPAEVADQARMDLAGYYAHCTALDGCFGQLLAAVDRFGLADDTILVFTSDHGDMLGSQGCQRKQKPWEESVRVPFLIRWPAGLGRKPGERQDLFIDAQDMMPTLLGLAGAPIPDAVTGLDYSASLRRAAAAPTDATVLACYHPFGEWPAGGGGGVFGHTGREYRGLRTAHYTYVRSLDGPWLFYDNEHDPYQLHNLVDDPSRQSIRRELDHRLDAELAARSDEFQPGTEYLERWDYQVDETGTMPFAR